MGWGGIVCVRWVGIPGPRCVAERGLGEGWAARATKLISSVEHSLDKQH